MSRTYRKTDAGINRRWMPSGKTRKEFIGKYLNGVKYEDEWEWFHWVNSCPKEWRKYYTHIPARAKNRNILRKVKSEYYDPDETIYYDHKKPHIYYW